MVGLGALMVSGAVTAVEFELKTKSLGPPLLLALAEQVMVVPTSESVRP
jgi:hypothetical protein